MMVKFWTIYVVAFMTFLNNKMEMKNLDPEEAKRIFDGKFESGLEAWSLMLCLAQHKCLANN